MLLTPGTLRSWNTPVNTPNGAKRKGVRRMKDRISNTSKISTTVFPVVVAIINLLLYIHVI